MIQFSLKQLRYFLAAADRGNVTEAAQHLNSWQPAISAAEHYMAAVGLYIK